MVDMSNDFLFRSPCTVRMHEVGAEGTAPIQVLLRYFQEAASLHSHRLGWGGDDLMRQNLAWVLARLTIEVERLPLAWEQLEIRTWPQSSTKYSAKRDFLMVDAQEKILARGGSNWVMMDVEARRMKSIPQAFQESFSQELPPPVAQFQGKKVPGLGECTASTEIIVRNEDLDINGHANNTHFAAWVLEPVSSEFASRNQLRSLDIQFRSEVRSRDRLTVRCGPGDAGELGNEVLCHSLIKEDGNESARARTTWRAR